jgi:hypothetical protein
MPWKGFRLFRIFHAFVYESRPEPSGALFPVSVVVTDYEYENVNDALIEIEELSGRRPKKWSKG